jgi:hypothetical protein
LGVSPLVRNREIDNLAPLLVYGVGVRDVDTVISNGHIVVRHHELTLTPEKTLATKLSKLSSDLTKRRSTGKTWEEDVALKWRPGSYKGPQRWFRFRSVRSKDTVYLAITNRGRYPLDIAVAMSGTAFGGTVGAMLQKKVRKRFPLDHPKHYWTRRITLEPGQGFVLRKEAGGKRYTLTLPDQTSRRLACTKSHQLCLYRR